MKKLLFIVVLLSLLSALFGGYVLIDDEKIRLFTWNKIFSKYCSWSSATAQKKPGKEHKYGLDAEYIRLFSRPLPAVWMRTESLQTRFSYNITNFVSTFVGLQEYIGESGKPFDTTKLVPNTFKALTDCSNLDYTNQPTYPKTGDTNFKLWTVSQTCLNGVFKLICKVSTVSVTDEKYGFTIDPDSMKCDVEINDFKYTKDNGKVALLSYFINTDNKFRASTTKKGFKNGGKGVSFGDIGEKKGSFIWEKHAEIRAQAGGSVQKTGNVINGELKSVAKGELSTGLNLLLTLSIGSNIKTNSMWFVFDDVKAKNIFWDPRISVYDQGLNPGSIKQYSFILIGIVFILGLLF